MTPRPVLCVKRASSRLAVDQHIHAKLSLILLWARGIVAARSAWGRHEMRTSFVVRHRRADGSRKHAQAPPVSPMAASERLMLLRGNRANR